MNIAILIISTGKYNKFVPPLLKSLELFNSDDKKDVFLFSDVENPEAINYSIKDQKWPFITLLRFHTFKQAYDRLQEYDFILYMDVDLEVISKININLTKTKLLGVQHPGSYRINNFWPIETNPKSEAKLPLDSPKVYCQGCLWGASKELFFDLNNTLINNIQKDLSNNYISLWHDESHLNHYFYYNSDKLDILSSSFAYPENWNLPIPKFIIHKDKNMQEYPRFAGAGSE